jgi:DNA-binding PadR family transcriptional regulator
MSVRHGLLALLVSAPKHGYQLRSELETATGGTWPLNIGQVYTTLQRLERDGLVRALEGTEEGQRPYEITGEGREELEQWLLAPLPRETSVRNELALKVSLAVAVGADVATVVQVQRRATIQLLQALRVARKPGDDPVAGLAADAVAFAAEAEVRWLDHAEAVISAAAPAARGEPSHRERYRAEEDREKGPGKGPEEGPEEGPGKGPGKGAARGGTRVTGNEVVLRPDGQSGGQSGGRSGGGNARAAGPVGG